MKKENLILVTSFVIMFVAAIILVSVIRTFPTGKIDEMFGQKVQVVNEKTVLDSDYVNIRTHADILDLNGTKLADLYTLTVNHKTYFDMELFVAIDLKGKVYAIDKSVQTHDDTSASYFNLVRSYLLKNYNGLYYENVEFVDGAAGATTIGVSRSMIKTAITQAVLYHTDTTVDYIGLLLKNTDYKINSTVTSGDVTIYDVTFENKAIKVYQTKGSGTYYDSQATETGEITLFAALNDEKVITNVLLPDDLYNHSGGGFYNATKAYAESYINQNIASASVDFTSGPSINSDGSQYLVSKLFENIQGVA